jgi:YbgC/YbaW family acyl-CoA thioester hydrolase
MDMHQDSQVVLATFKTNRRIRFADTNNYGHVHFDIYVRLMEETEYAFLRSRGLRVVLEDGMGIIGFPRLCTDVRLTAPLCMGDVAETTLRLTQVNGKKITYEFDINLFDHPIAVGKFEVACCRFPDGKDPYAILIPDFVSEKLCEDSAI